MAGHIFVDEQAALNSAVAYDGIAQDYAAIETSAADLESELFGAWEGEAASAFKGTLACIDNCTLALEQDVLIHAGLIRNAEGKFIDKDTYLASTYTWEKDFTQVRYRPPER